MKFVIFWIAAEGTPKSPPSRGAWIEMAAR